MPDEQNENTENVQENNSSSDFETGSITVKKNGHFIHCLTIIGQIEGHYILPSQNKTTKYEHVIPQLVAIEESAEIEGLLIILNTVGGDVEAGLAIAELLSTMKLPQPLSFSVAAIQSACRLRFHAEKALSFRAPR